MALFVRGGVDGRSAIGVMQPITARDEFVLASGEDHVITGLSEGSARAFGVAAIGAWHAAFD